MKTKVQTKTIYNVQLEMSRDQIETLYDFITKSLDAQSWSEETVSLMKDIASVAKIVNIRDEIKTLSAKDIDKRSKYDILAPPHRCRMGRKESLGVFVGYDEASGNPVYKRSDGRYMIVFPDFNSYSSKKPPIKKHNVPCD